MSRGTLTDLPQEDQDRIHLHDLTMDTALAQGRTLWEAQAAALKAVADQAANRAHIDAWEESAGDFVAGEMNG